MIVRKFKKIDQVWSIREFNKLHINDQKLIFNEINQYLESLTIENRVEWAIKYLPKQSILSSSFGIHSSVSLHLITCYYPDIPVVLIDTGYLFPETYRFIDQLTEEMKLNLKVFRPSISSAWQETRYGKLWEKGIQGIQKYNLINKIEPMHSVFKKFKVNLWFAGLRRNQSYSRKHLPIITIQNGIFKFLPIIDWDDDQIHKYIKKYNLKYHPLWYKGYVSVGDIHTTSIKKPGMKDEDTRFYGLQRECGLHVPD